MNDERKGDVPPMISVRSLVKRFGEKTVLAGLDLDIARGESVVVIGGSGTGKSVLLKCILGLLIPDQGEVWIDGEKTTRYTGNKRMGLMHKFGLLFQGSALFDSLLVWENVAFGLIEGQRMPRHKARAIAVDMLAQVGLAASVGDLYPAELSGGMQKRVALARAIATTPEVLFFDEPTTGLDPIMGDVINNLIVDCVRRLGATTLTITHDMSSAFKIADRVGMLHEGRLVWIGPTSQVRQSGNPYVEQFIHGRAEGPIKMALKS